MESNENKATLIGAGPDLNATGNKTTLKIVLNRKRENAGQLDEQEGLISKKSKRFELDASNNDLNMDVHVGGENPISDPINESRITMEDLTSTGKNAPGILA